MPNGIDLILADHRRVEALFAEFDETGDGAIIGQVVDALTGARRRRARRALPARRPRARRRRLIERWAAAHSAVKKQIDLLRTLEGDRHWPRRSRAAHSSRSTSPTRRRTFCRRSPSSDTATARRARRPDPPSQTTRRLGYKSIAALVDVVAMLYQRYGRLGGQVPMSATMRGACRPPRARSRPSAPGREPFAGGAVQVGGPAGGLGGVSAAGPEPGREPGEDIANWKCRGRCPRRHLTMSARRLLTLPRTASPQRPSPWRAATDRSAHRRRRVQVGNEGVTSSSG